MTGKHNIRVRGGFSDRNSIKPIPKDIQFTEFNESSRIALFISFKNDINYLIEARNLNTDTFTKLVIENVFNEIYLEYKHSYNKLLDDLFDIFKTEEYDAVLTIIEYVCNWLFQVEENIMDGLSPNDIYRRTVHLDIRESMNQAFEKEYIGYRFLGENIVAITNKQEIETIRNAWLTPYEKVNQSIEKAIDFISETSNKDYKNSIKESITDLEQLLNILLEKDGLTLGNAIEQFIIKFEIDEDLKNAIKSLYKYASNINGVRHGNNKNNDKIGFEEAKLVLLICSSSINYFCSLTAKK